ncbi:hypothetical protein AAFF_G00290370 [Aldrovandia affinis]|uniref:Uncharacterized protein n=1 Tax=Aldrovandia affinis TaxID=143900 RepID=A0AAD7W1M4_9TELE|nr:hypothetical protein AAFF_G00290370 [Aldrovandia affinis]
MEPYIISRAQRVCECERRQCAALCQGAAGMTGASQARAPLTRCWPGRFTLSQGSVAITGLRPNPADERESSLRARHPPAGGRSVSL